MLPEMTLAELRAAVRQRADMVNSEFVSDDELSGYINNSLYSLYDLLVTTYGEDYFAKEVEVVTDGSEFIDLPADFYKLLGVDVVVSGDQRVTLRQFNRMERNRSSWLGGVRVASPWYNVRYRLRAGKLWLTPTPSTGQTLRLIYVPRLAPLCDPLKLTVESTLVDGDAATFAFADEDGVRQSVTLIANGGGSTDFIIAVSDNDGGIDVAQTAESLKDCILDNIPVSAYHEVPFSGEPGDNPDVVLHDTHDRDVTVFLQPGVKGLALSGGLTRSEANASGVTHTVHVVPKDENLSSDGISGWLEYVVVDAAIKCLVKEESDTRVLGMQRDQLVRRITDSAPNRDAGEPPRVTDVTRTGGWNDLDLPGGPRWWD